MSRSTLAACTCPFSAAVSKCSDACSILSASAAADSAARGSAAAAPGAAVAVAGATASTPHTAVVDQLAAVSLPVATQTEATAAASDTQAAAGAVVAKAAAGSQAESAAADAPGDSASGQKAEPKGPSAAEKAPAPGQKAAVAVQKAPAPSQKVAAAARKALPDADTALGPDVAQLAEPDDSNVTEAKPIAAVQAATGASKAILLDVTGTRPSAFSKLMLEDRTTVKPALASIALTHLYPLKFVE